MKQTKKTSFIESVTQTIIELLTSIYLLQFVVLYLLGILVSFKQNLIIAGAFFVVSIARGYLVRRFFNKK